MMQRHVCQWCLQKSGLNDLLSGRGKEYCWWRASVQYGRVGSRDGGRCMGRFHGRCRAWLELRKLLLMCQHPRGLSLTSFYLTTTHIISSCWILVSKKLTTWWSQNQATATKINQHASCYGRVFVGDGVPCVIFFHMGTAEPAPSQGRFYSSANSLIQDWILRITALLVWDVKVGKQPWFFLLRGCCRAQLEWRNVSHSWIWVSHSWNMSVSVCSISFALCLLCFFIGTGRKKLWERIWQEKWVKYECLGRNQSILKYMHHRSILSNFCINWISISDSIGWAVKQQLKKRREISALFVLHFFAILVTKDGTQILRRHLLTAGLSQEAGLKVISVWCHWRSRTFFVIPVNFRMKHIVIAWRPRILNDSVMTKKTWWRMSWW